MATLHLIILLSKVMPFNNYLIWPNLLKDYACLSINELEVKGPSEHFLFHACGISDFMSAYVLNAETFKFVNLWLAITSIHSKPCPSCCFWCLYNYKCFLTKIVYHGLCSSLFSGICSYPNYTLGQSTVDQTSKLNIIFRKLLCM